MKRSLLLLGCLLATALQAQSPQIDTQDKRLKGLDKELEALLDELHIAGFGVAIVEGEDVLYAKGIGYRDLENQVPADANTLFAIGSCTKAFTSSLLGQLREEEKVDFNESPITYLPDLRFQNDQMNQLITVQDLMCHRTGLPRHDFSWYFFPTASETELMERMAHMEPTFDVRQRWQYNNFGFLLQGMIAGSLYGQTWAEAVKTHLFEPLGMDRSVLSVAELEQVENRSLGYEVREKDQVKKLDYYQISGMSAAGSIYSSANDMAEWLKLWIADGKRGEEEILSERYAVEATTPQMSIPAGIFNKEYPDLHMMSYGYGWFMSSYRGHYQVEHGGNIDGFSASTCFFPSDGIGIVVLANQDGSLVPTLARRIIADRMLELEPGTWLKDLKKAMKENGGGEKKDEDEEEKPEGVASAHSLSDFEGAFMHPGYGTIQVVLREDSLFACLPQDTFWLKHKTYDAFSPVLVEELTESGQEELGQINLNFQTNNRGEVDAVEIPLEPSLENPLIFTRQIEEQPITEADMQPYVGTYEIENVPIEVYIRNGETLYTEVPGQPPYALIPTGEHTFAFRDLEGYSMEFLAKEDGSIKAVTFNQPNGVFTAKRKK